MIHHNTTLLTTYLEEAVAVLFCLMDDTYRLLNIRETGYSAPKQLSDSKVMEDPETLIVDSTLLANRGTEHCPREEHPPGFANIAECAH